MRTVALIPARLAATRLPGKPLAMLGELPLIVRVIQQVRRASCIDSVYVATDADAIIEAVEHHGFQAKRSASHHQSGSDRIAEVAATMTNVDLILNVQGDEPFVDPASLDALVDAMKNSASDMGTLCTPLRSSDELHNPNIVKVVTDSNSRAMYFSRAPIPFCRNDSADFHNAKRHVGVYAYRPQALQRFANASQHPLEVTEGLEQLRALAMGLTITVVEVAEALPGIDTPEDLQRAEHYLRQRHV